MSKKVKPTGKYVNLAQVQESYRATRKIEGKRTTPRERGTKTVPQDSYRMVSTIYTWVSSSPD